MEPCSATTRRIQGLCCSQSNWKWSIIDPRGSLESFTIAHRINAVSMRKNTALYTMALFCISLAWNIEDMLLWPPLSSRKKSRIKEEFTSSGKHYVRSKVRNNFVWPALAGFSSKGQWYDENWKVKSGDGKKAEAHTEREGKRKLTGRNSKRSESSVTSDWLIRLL